MFYILQALRNNRSMYPIKIQYLLRVKLANGTVESQNVEKIASGAPERESEGIIILFLNSEYCISIAQHVSCDVSRGGHQQIHTSETDDVD